MIFSLSLAAALLAAPVQGKSSPDATTLQAEAASTEKAAESAASAADSANKAAVAAEHAAEAAQKAAEAAASAAQAAQKAANSTATATAPATQATPPAPPAPPAPPPPPPVIWTSVINLGMIALTGNSQTLAFNVGGNVQRKGPEWIVGIKAGAQYGQTRDNSTGENTVTAEAAAVQVRGDKRLSPAFSTYLLTGIETDHIKSIEERPYGEFGGSLVWFDVKEGDLEKSILRTDLGFRYGREYRFQYIPTPLNLGEVDIVAPHLEANYRYAVSKEIIFTEDLDLVANLQGDARLLLVNTAKIAARLTDSLNLAVSFVVNYDSLPPPPKQGTDTALTVGVDIAL